MSELWFIYSPQPHDWADLRVATFISDIVVIHNETPDRTGPRVWSDIERREGWVKVSRIEPPTEDEVRRALG